MPNQNYFRESVSALLADLQALREEWLQIEESLRRDFRHLMLSEVDLTTSRWRQVIDSKVRQLEKDADFEFLRRKTEKFLRELNQLCLRCPISHIGRFKPIRAEMESISLVRQGVW